MSPDRSPPSGQRVPSTRRRVLRGSALLCAGGLAGCTFATSSGTETVDLSADADGAETVGVAVRNGDVTLTGADTDAVTGTATKRTDGDGDLLEAVSVGLSVEDGHVSLDVEWPEGYDEFGTDAADTANVSVDVDLTVPEDLSVMEVETVNGAITVTGLPVGIDRESEFRSLHGVIRTQNGDVELEAVDGLWVYVESVNGDVTLQNVGDVGDVYTRNGDIEADLPSVDGSEGFRSTNGDVTVAIPEDAGIGASLETTNGEAAVEGLPLSVENRSETRIAGTLGDRDGELTLRTVNGDVTLTSN